MGAFYEAKLDARFSGLLRDFLFDTNGDSPYCEELDDLLLNKHIAGVVGLPNPTWSENRINAARPDGWSDDVRAMFGVDADAFEQMVALLSDRLVLLRRFML